VKEVDRNGYLLLIPPDPLSTIFDFLYPEVIWLSIVSGQQEAPARHQKRMGEE
jgi:hypothetical protein